MRKSMTGATGLVVAVGALVGTLLVAEGFLRVFHPIEWERPAHGDAPNVWSNLIHQPSAVPGLDYEIAPNDWNSKTRTREGINRFGLRGREPNEPKTDTRIAVLGDSFTYGLGVRARETYPAVLHRLLGERPDREPCEVLNLGVTAYALSDVAIAMKWKAFPLDPDLIIVGYVLNDPQIGASGQPIRVYYHQTRWWQHFHVFRLAAKAKRDWDCLRLGDGDYIRYLYEDAGTWSGVIDDLEKMRRDSRERELDVVFVIFPMIPEETWDEYPYLDIHERVAGAARAAGFPVLDLYAAMATESPSALRLGGGDWHPSAVGYDVAAGAIRDFLVAEGLLP